MRCSEKCATLALVLVVTLGGLMVGCASPSINDPARVGPFYRPINFTGDTQLPPNLRRVILMPLAAGTIASSESASALDTVFLAQLQQENRFEVVPLTREECLRRFRAEEFVSTGVLPAGFMASLQRDFAADGVLFLDLTVYKPYRPLAIGVRAKLSTISPDPRILWAFDNLFSSDDASVANAARHHALEGDRRGVPADYTQAVLQSPSRFVSYVADATFATLPPVYGKPAPSRK